MPVCQGQAQKANQVQHTRQCLHLNTLHVMCAYMGTTYSCKYVHLPFGITYLQPQEQIIPIGMVSLAVFLQGLCSSGQTLCNCTGLIGSQ